MKTITQMSEDEKLCFFRGYIHAHAEKFAKKYGYTTKEARILILKGFIKYQEIKLKKEHFDGNGDTQR
ncbi:hypothetical protein IIO_06169 [Bacillus cereus VD115]|nr:hypothetical protein IIO_06243 [Bacillus cereus VD115]EJR52597.1 hypothetical protein IIO_06169 [Bacillus cereus VD115]